MKKTTSPEKLHFYSVPLDLENEPEIAELRTNVSDKYFSDKTDKNGKKKPNKKTHEKINAELDALMRMIFALFSLCASCYNRINNPRCDMTHPSGKPMDSGYITDWLLSRMIYGRATDDEARICELFAELVAAGIVAETEPDSGVLCVPIFQRIQSFVPDADDDAYTDKRTAANWRQEKSRLEQKEGRKATQRDKNAYLAKVAIRKLGNVNTRDYINELHDWCYKNAGDNPGEVPTPEQWLDHIGANQHDKPRGKDCKPVDVDAEDFDDDDIPGDGSGEFYGDDE